jgi:hypothetical protein
VAAWEPFADDFGLEPPPEQPAVITASEVAVAAIARSVRREPIGVPPQSCRIGFFNLRP